MFDDLLLKSQNRLHFFLKCLNWFFILSLTFLLGLLNLLHWGVLVIKNKSTIEFCENKKHIGKYDLGKFKNIAQIFGRNPFYYILPIGTYKEVNGLTFEENYLDIDHDKEDFEHLVL